MHRDKIMDVLLAIGIIYVVLGHNYQPLFIPFRAYSFHMALFFFISGSFFKAYYDLHEKARWMMKKTVKTLVPYCILNLLFAFFTLFLRTQHIELGKEIGLYALGIAPILHGHQFQLFAPAWFVIQLLIVHLIYQSLYWQKPFQIAPQLITLLLLTLSVFLVSTNLNGMNDFKRLLIRTSFSSTFYSIGFLYATYKERLNPFLLRPDTLLLALIGYAILEALYKPLTYELVWARFFSPSPFAPFISSFLMLIILLNLAHGFAAFFPFDNIIYRIGQHTFAIMCFHLTVFFGINIIFWLLGLIDYEKLSQGNYRWNVTNIWFLYSIPGVLIPTYGAILCDKLVQKLRRPVSQNRTTSL